MKISKSKRELAKIISENGGWRDEAEWAWFQGKLKGGPRHEVWFGEAGSEPEYVAASGSFHCYWSMVVDRFSAKKFDNWHQTILSRAEYFYLYPAPDADGWIEWKGGECPVEKGTLVDVIWRSGIERVGVKALHIGGAGHQFWVADGMVNDIIAYRLHKPDAVKPTDFGAIGDDETNLAVKDGLESMEYRPTIEQLAADYRNAKDYADRKQQEADDAKADADARLKTLELAGEDIGLLLSPITANKEPEPVITDWRDLRVGDVISVSGKWWEPDSEYTVDENDGSRDAPIRVGGYWALIGECSFKFIRRP